ncbi:hypothetical protein LTR27_011008 [Elasticomyces elasticus]|nr:hypothetical protein LTR27_011008 [Elasticomyces elasticus]
MTTPGDLEKDLKHSTTTATELGIATGHVTNDKGADGVLQYAAAEAVEVDEATNKRLLWAIDIHVMPWLCGLYVLQFLDKGVLSYAGVMGLQQETNMSSFQYSWLGSIYYVGYMFAVPIHNRLMQRFPPSKHIAGCMALWGVVLTTMAACDNWDRPHDSTNLPWEPGGLAYGCVAGLEVHPNMQFTSWKILALCTGLISVIYGVCMFFFLADSVVTARWLSNEDRTLAVERLRNNHQGVGSTQYKTYQAREAWLDYRTWTYVLFVLVTQIPSAGLVLLNSILVKSLGFDTKTTLLLSMPGGLVNIIANFGFGLMADRTHKRLLACIIATLVSIFGAALFIGLGNVSPLHARIGQLVGYFLMSGTSSTAWFLVISLMSSNVLGHTKKTSSNAIVFTAQGLAYFVGPLCFTDGPYYHKAKIMTLAMWIGALLLLATMWVLNWQENSRRDGEMTEKGVSEHAASDLAFHDLTDKVSRIESDVFCNCTDGKAGEQGIQIRDLTC